MNSGSIRERGKSVRPTGEKAASAGKRKQKKTGKEKLIQIMTDKFHSGRGNHFQTSRRRRRRKKLMLEKKLMRDKVNNSSLLIPQNNHIEKPSINKNKRETATNLEIFNLHCSG